MKTNILILILGYGVPSLICFFRLLFDKTTTSIKAFLAYWYFPFIPLYNLVMVWFILKEVKNELKNYFSDDN